MTQNAIVINLIDQDWAEVSISRVSACGDSCASCGAGCAEKKILTAAAFNHVKAKPGDKVRIESDTGRIVSYAFLVYIVPLAFFIIAYAISEVFIKSEKISILISVCAFLLGCASVVLINKYIRRDRKLVYRIIEIIS